MKSLVLIVSSIFVFSFTGGKEIPASIKRSFIQRYPTAYNVRWEGSAQTNYEVGFVQDGKENVAVFLPDGTYKETETEIKTSELPKRVIKSISKKYPLSKIGFAIKIQRSNNTVVYDIEVKTGIEDIDITLDSMGYEVD